MCYFPKFGISFFCLWIALSANAETASFYVIETFQGVIGIRSDPPPSDVAYTLAAVWDPSGTIRPYFEDFLLLDSVSQFGYLYECIRKWEAHGNDPALFAFLDAIYTIYRNDSHFAVPLARFVLEAGRQNQAIGTHGILARKLAYRRLNLSDVQWGTSGVYWKEREDHPRGTFHELLSKQNHRHHWLEATLNPDLALRSFHHSTKAHHTGELESPIAVLDLEDLESLRSEGDAAFFRVSDHPYDHLVASIVENLGDRFGVKDFTLLLDIYQNPDFLVDLKDSPLYKILMQAILPNLTNLKVLTELKSKQIDLSLDRLTQLFTSDDVAILKTQYEQLEALKPLLKKGSTSRQVCEHLKDVIAYRMVWLVIHNAKTMPLFVQFYRYLDSQLMVAQTLTPAAYYDLLFGDGSVHALDQRQWHQKENHFYRTLLEKYEISKSAVEGWWNDAKQSQPTSQPGGIILHKAIHRKSLVGLITHLNPSTGGYLPMQLYKGYAERNLKANPIPPAFKGIFMQLPLPDQKHIIYRHIAWFIQTHGKFPSVEKIKQLKHEKKWPCCYEYMTKELFQGWTTDPNSVKESYARWAGMSSFAEWKKTVLKEYERLNVFYVIDAFVEAHGGFPNSLDILKPEKKDTWPYSYPYIVSEGGCQGSGLFRGWKDDRDSVKESYARWKGFGSFVAWEDAAIKGPKRLAVFHAIDAFVEAYGEFPTALDIQKSGEKIRWPCSYPSIVSEGGCEDTGLFRGWKDDRDSVKESYARWKGFASFVAWDEGTRKKRERLAVFRAVDAFVKSNRAFPTYRDIHKMSLEGVWPHSYHYTVSAGNCRGTGLFQRLRQHRDSLKESYARWKGFVSFSEFAQIHLGYAAALSPQSGKRNRKSIHLTLHRMLQSVSCGR